MNICSKMAGYIDLIQVRQIFIGLVTSQTLVLPIQSLKTAFTLEAIFLNSNQSPDSSILRIFGVESVCTRR